MNSRMAGAALLAASMAAATAAAQDNDLAEGEKLFVSQCKICHGGAPSHAGARTPLPLQQQALHLAMHQPAGTTLVDFPVPMAAGSPGEDARLAFAPPFGPHLRGVYGRPAGTVKEFSYSPAFLKSLKGMEWNEATLNVWITSPQAWVPGVYMFYKQPNAEIRRKIIAYLKANP